MSPRISSRLLPSIRKTYIQQHLSWYLSLIQFACGGQQWAEHSLYSRSVFVYSTSLLVYSNLSQISRACLIYFKQLFLRHAFSDIQHLRAMAAEVQILPFAILVQRITHIRRTGLERPTELYLQQLKRWMLQYHQHQSWEPLTLPYTTNEERYHATCLPKRQRRCSARQGHRRLQGGRTLFQGVASREGH